MLFGLAAGRRAPKGFKGIVIQDSWSFPARPTLVGAFERPGSTARWWAADSQKGARQHLLGHFRFPAHERWSVALFESYAGAAVAGKFFGQRFSTARRR
jgi:hypothetical protein